MTQIFMTIISIRTLIFVDFKIQMKYGKFFVLNVVNTTEPIYDEFYFGYYFYHNLDGVFSCGLRVCLRQHWREIRMLGLVHLK